MHNKSTTLLPILIIVHAVNSAAHSWSSCPMQTLYMQAALSAFTASLKKYFTKMYTHKPTIQYTGYNYCAVYIYTSWKCGCIHGAVFVGTDCSHFHLQLSSDVYIAVSSLIQVINPSHLWPPIMSWLMVLLCGMEGLPIFDKVCTGQVCSSLPHVLWGLS
jgi:hypothetical protein